MTEQDKVIKQQLLHWNSTERAYKVCDWKGHRHAEAVNGNIASCIVWYGQGKYYANHRRECADHLKQFGKPFHAYQDHSRK